jgi:hypothetical protein
MKKTASALILMILVGTVLFSQEAGKTGKQGKITPSISGKIENIANDKIGIISNEKSKSRVTYVIEGDDSELRKNVGKFAAVTGEVTKTNSPWKKILKLKKVVRIYSEEKPAPAKKTK